MRTRRFWLVLAVLLLLPARVRADRHKWEMAAGISRDGRSALWGGSFSVGVVVDKYNLSGFALFGKNAGRHAGATLTETSFLGGGRWWLRGGKRAQAQVAKDEPPPPQPKLLPFVTVLFGRLEDEVNGASDGSFVWGAGAGVDALFTEHGGLRGQIEFVRHRPGDVDEDFVRYSVGLVYRFEQKPSPTPPPPPQPPPSP